MNAAFREPLVVGTRGGTRGGGARLTDAGTVVLENYRRLEGRVAEAGAGEIEALRAMVRDGAGG